MFNISKSKQKGFTLVEMIVSLGIFSIVAIVAVGALLKITDANKKSHTLKVAMNNINFSLESIMREIKMGSNYACDSSLNNIKRGNDLVEMKPCDIFTGSWYLGLNSDVIGQDNGNSKTCNLITIFKYDSTIKNILKASQKSCGDVINDNNFISAMSPEVVLTSGKIKVFKYDSNTSKRQPYVTLNFVGYSGEKDKTKTDFNIQTSATQRNIVIVPTTPQGGGGSGSGSDTNQSILLSNITFEQEYFCGTGYSTASTCWTYLGNPYRGYYLINVSYSSSLSDPNTNIYVFKDGNQVGSFTAGSGSQIKQVWHVYGGGSFWLCSYAGVAVCSNVQTFKP